MKQFFVYILTNKKYGVLYTGVTSDLLKRIWEHREGGIEGFTQKYRTKLLVYYEPHETAEAAIRREKQIKEWQRMWKIELIERMNPGWDDLAIPLGFNPLLEIPASAGMTAPRKAAMTKTNRKKVTIYTDGACSGNPGPGG